MIALILRQAFLFTIKAPMTSAFIEYFIIKEGFLFQTKVLSAKKIRNILSNLGASYGRDHLPFEGYSQFWKVK